MTVFAAVFPLKRSADNRTMVDQQNNPFIIMGRTSWFITSLSSNDYTYYLNDCTNRGYNSIEFHVLNHDPRGNNEPYAGNGALPFLKQLNGNNWNGSLTYANINNEALDYTTENTNYWNHVDGLLKSCNDRGIQVFMFPSYVGYNGSDQGWMNEMVANGTNRMYQYGAWLANRYKNQSNLVWMLCGDKGGTISFTASEGAVEQMMANGLRSVAGMVPTNYSAELNSETIATDDQYVGNRMTINGAYSWTGDVITQCRRGYSYSPTMPTFLLEEPYDEEGSDGNGYNPSATQPVRRFQWWGCLSGIGGYISGNGYVWPFNAGWTNHLNTQGSRDMVRMHTFIRSVNWHQLVPSGLSGMRTLVVSNANNVTAAANTNGDLLVVYRPPSHTGSFSVSLVGMKSNLAAQWFDPTSAQYFTTTATSGKTNVYTVPGNNSVGQADWVLLITASDPPKLQLTLNPPNVDLLVTGTPGIYTLYKTYDTVWSTVWTRTSVVDTISYSEPIEQTNKLFRVARH